MTKARDLANAGTALTSVSATELGYVDGVTSAIQTQIDSKEPTLPSQTGNSGKYLTTDGTNKSWGTVSQYSLPSQTGNSGKFLTTNGTSESWGAVTQPITWTHRFNMGGRVQGFATNGSNIYVAVGEAGRLYSSTDSGATWTSRTSGFGSTSIWSVEYGNGIFVAVGDSGTITTSTDGITWTARTSGVSTNALYSVRYLNGNFVAVGNGGNAGTGGVTTSTDGITWTKRNTPSSSPGRLESITYGNGYYVAGGSFNVTGGIYSTNLSTWTALPTSVAAGANHMTYIDGRFIGLNRGSRDIYYTGNNPSAAWTALLDKGIYWSVPGSSDGNKEVISQYDNKFYYRWTDSGTPFPGIAVMSTSFDTTNGFAKALPMIPTPFKPNSTTVVSSAPFSLLVTSDGKILISTNDYNVFTSF